MAAPEQKTAGARASATGRNVKIGKSFKQKTITANDMEAIGVAFIAGGFCVMLAFLFEVAR